MSEHRTFAEHMSHIITAPLNGNYTMNYLGGEYENY